MRRQGLLGMSPRKSAPVDPPAPEELVDDPFGQDPEFVAQMEAMIASGLSPASAMRFLARLIAGVRGTSKEGMEKIKMMDKLLNTARAMMETKLKNEEATAINRRLDDIEERVQQISAHPPARSSNPTEELWHGRADDE
ncbi:MAG: hypothetical protein AB1646_11920 [Thermodesulfobacteriota bacterium]